jgi:hypothetical protein
LDGHLYRGKQARGELDHGVWAHNLESSQYSLSVIRCFISKHAARLPHGKKQEEHMRLSPFLWKRKKPHVFYTHAATLV